MFKQAFKFIKDLVHILILNPQILLKDGSIKYTSTGGTIGYYVNKKLHREDGPAVIYTDGGYEWFKNGVRHRLDGPARHLPRINYNEWWVNGTQCVNRIQYNIEVARYLRQNEHKKRTNK